MIEFRKTLISYSVEDLKSLEEVVACNPRLSGALDVALGMGLFSNIELPRRAVFIAEMIERIQDSPEKVVDKGSGL